LLSNRGPEALGLPKKSIERLVEIGHRTCANLPEICDDTAYAVREKFILDPLSVLVSTE